MNTDDTRTETRLQREAAQNFLGLLGHDNFYSDTCRAEVSWTDSDGLEHAGYFRVNVLTRPGYHKLSEEEQMTGHPASIAERKVSATMERRASERDYWSWSLDDVTSW